MRFDYIGTGDSAGASGAGSIEEWTANVRDAAQELRETSGLEKISMVGVRLGGAVAAYAATEEESVETLLLWDPVSDGTRYLNNMIDMHDAFVVDLDRFPEGHVRDVDASGNELVGMPFTDEFRKSLERIDLLSIANLNARKIAVVVTDDQPRYRQTSKHFRSLVGPCSYHVLDEPASWDALSDLGVAIMPHELLRSVVAIMEGNVD
jgi:pimeloyl-ACP methyl ester carboxylesterase